MLVIGSCKDILNYFHFIILSRWFFQEKRHLFLLLLLQSPLSWPPFPLRSPQSSLRCAVGSHQLPALYTVSIVYIVHPSLSVHPLFCSFIFPCTHWAPDSLSCWAAGRQGGKQRSEKMGAILSPPVTASNPGPQSVCGAPHPSVVFWPFSLHSSPLPSPLIRMVLCPWLSPQPSRQAGRRYFQHLLGNDPFGDDYSHGPCGQQNRETVFLVPVNSWNAGSFFF